MSERTTPEETAAMLDQVRGFVTDYVVLPATQYADVVTLWTVHAHAAPAAETSPRLLFKSPEKESGKTRALEVLEVLTPGPIWTFNATIAALFRSLGDGTTLLFDEVDAVFSPKSGNHEDLRALLNTGYRRGATVRRCVGEGKKTRVEEFPVFCPTALAAIGDLPDTIESRAIVVPMRRRAPDEAVRSFRRRKALLEAGELRDWLRQWAEEHVDRLTEAEPEMPEGVTDRAADCWEALLAIADLAGEEWARRAREAAVFVVKGRVAEDQSVGVRLLADIKAQTEGLERVHSQVLCDRLNALDESPWGGWNDGKGINPRDLAKRLRNYRVESKDVRIGDSVKRGYLLADLADPFARYLREGSATSATSATQIRIGVADVADVADSKATSNGRCYPNCYPDGWHGIGSNGTPLPGPWPVADRADVVAWAQANSYEIGR